ncbi:MULTISPECIES: MarR family transcriptional regulator [Bacillus cereus group]|uniref:MarR family transcriptional regulator n=1 Tax=Bacillus cereus group TaxID=86661 RepID=UPI000995AB12|nr:MarR family transcriptional regulator [Bacillus cereus]
MTKSLYRILELDREEVSASEKLILLTIAIYSDNKFIPFSITELEYYTNLSRATVTRLVKQIEEKGFIEVQRNGTATNAYKVTLCK